MRHFALIHRAANDYDDEHHHFAEQEIADVELASFWFWDRKGGLNDDYWPNFKSNSIASPDHPAASRWKGDGSALAPFTGS